MTLRKRSFLTQDAYDNAEKLFGHIEISVANTPVVIKGILKENFSISTEANYDNIFSVSEKLEGARKVLDFALGATFLNTGQWTRKYYKGGSYMKITPKFRVVDYNGDGDPLLSAFMLMNSCLPTPGKHDRFLEDMKDLTWEDFRRKFGIVDLPDAITGNGNNDGITFNNTVSNVKSVFSNGFKQLKDLLAGQIGNSPSSVSVRVSNYFSWDEMVIESVNVEFSKEMTRWGPLYVDIDAVLSSREVATKGRTGLEHFDSRFQRVDGNSGNN